jgi:hypothetical protein
MLQKKVRDEEKGHVFESAMQIVVTTGEREMASCIIYADVTSSAREIWCKILVGKPKGKKPPGRQRRKWVDDTVTHKSIARQRLGNHIPAGTNALNNRTSIGRQRISKHASLIIESVFCPWSVQNGYKEVFGSID